MKSIGLYLCQPRSSTFHFIELFPPKDSMKEFMENRGRQDELDRRQVLQVFPDRRDPAHLSNIQIVVAILPTLQIFLPADRLGLRVKDSCA